MTMKMRNTWYVIPANEDICHYGILGMKWGVRRYQNTDGTLTSAGRKRYYNKDGSAKGIYAKNTKESMQYMETRLATNKTALKRTKDLDRMFLNSNVYKHLDDLEEKNGKKLLNSGIVRTKDTYGYTYTKEANTDVGNVKITTYNEYSDITPKELSSYFNNINKNASELVKTSSKNIINDMIENRLTNANEQEIKDVLNNSDIEINTSLNAFKTARGETIQSVNINFYPEDYNTPFGDHIITIEATIDYDTGKILDVDKHAQLNG